MREDSFRSEKFHMEALGSNCEVELHHLWDVPGSLEVHSQKMGSMTKFWRPLGISSRG